MKRNTMQPEPQVSEDYCADAKERRAELRPARVQT